MLQLRCVSAVLTLLAGQLKCVQCCKDAVRGTKASPGLAFRGGRKQPGPKNQGSAARTDGKK